MGGVNCLEGMKEGVGGEGGEEGGMKEGRRGEGGGGDEGREEGE